MIMQAIKITRQINRSLGEAMIDPSLTLLMKVLVSLWADPKALDLRTRRKTLFQIPITRKIPMVQNFTEKGRPSLRLDMDTADLFQSLVSRDARGVRIA
jgi:hypothetical protein